MEAADKEKALTIAKALTKDERVLGSVQTLLNLIPVAGGALANVLSEYRGSRNTKRIFETLDELRSAIERNPSEKHVLSQDQVIEMIHDTLGEIVRTSNDEKVAYLRNSLVRAFTNKEVSYPQKEQYLTVLKGLTTGELELLKVIYLSGDPFDRRYSEPLPTFDPQLGYTTASQLERMGTFVFPPIDEYEEPRAGVTLREVITRELNHISEAAIEGLIKSVDSKGLSSIEPNLERKTIKISKKRDLTQVGLFVTQVNTASLELPLGHPTRTPVEASRTRFGGDFIDYIRSKY